MSYYVVTNSEHVQMDVLSASVLGMQLENQRWHLPLRCSLSAACSSFLSTRRNSASIGLRLPAFACTSFVRKFVYMSSTPGHEGTAEAPMQLVKVSRCPQPEQQRLFDCTGRSYERRGCMVELARSNDSKAGCSTTQAPSTAAFAYLGSGPQATGMLCAGPVCQGTPGCPAESPAA